MNIILIEETRLRRADEGESALTVSREEVRPLVEGGRIKIGDRVRVGIIGGKIGWGRVVEVDREVQLIIEGFDILPPAQSAISLIVALPRPQILKRVLQSAAGMGVQSITLVRSARVEKSYLQSSLLKPEEVRRQLLLGLSQEVATQLPAVRIIERFSQLFGDDTGAFADWEFRGVAHTRTAEDFAALCRQRRVAPETRVLLAVGPEAGWHDHEIRAFKQQGFVPFSMGERIHRVDTAVIALLAQVDLLRRLDQG